ncbi:PadR family transcriptional regulator [Natrinema hispanicum]
MSRPLNASYETVPKSARAKHIPGFQRDLLYVIAGADQPSGQDVKDEIEQYYSSEINHGRLYPNLDTVVNKELVEKGQLDRRTNYYAITDEGEQAIEDRREWVLQYID